MRKMELVRKMVFAGCTPNQIELTAEVRLEVCWKEVVVRKIRGRQKIGSLNFSNESNFAQIAKGNPHSVANLMADISPINGMAMACGKAVSK